jgi:hypothetical protein
MWEPKPIGANALLDEPEHRRFLERCAKDLSQYDATPPQQQEPDAVTWAALDKRLNEICGNMLTVCKKFERRIERLEASQVKFCGVWKQGETYPENGLVSHQGGLWLCRAPTSSRPGSGSPAWRLCVKKGDAA